MAKFLSALSVYSAIAFFCVGCHSRLPDAETTRDQDILGKIASNWKLKNSQRLIAIEKLYSQEILAKVVLDDDSDDLRFAAFSRLVENSQKLSYPEPNSKQQLDVLEAVQQVTNVLNLFLHDSDPRLKEVHKIIGTFLNEHTNDSSAVNIFETAVDHSEAVRIRNHIRTVTVSDPEIASIEEKFPHAFGTDSGLHYIVNQEGSGDAAPKIGDQITAHYNGALLNGVKFDSSYDRGHPIQFQVGVGQVIQGWDEAFLAMKKGEKRTLIIPSKLGYGSHGKGGSIPPNATLLFDVELIDFE